MRETTPRLILRPWREDDIAPFAAMNQDPEVMEFFPSTATLEQSRALVERIQTHFIDHGFGAYAVELKSTGEFIGFVGLMIPTFESHFTPCVEIAWRIAKPFWNQGYATEAAKMVVHLAFDTFGLKEIVAFTPTLNQRSMRIMEKIGMHRDPRDDFDHPKIPTGHPLARCVLYRITKNDLQARDAILLEPYDPEWPKHAEAEIRQLKTRLNFSWIMGFQHIGSTSVPGLVAKPILDIAIGVTDLESAEALIPILREEGYLFWESNPDKSKWFFVKGMPPFGARRTHHIHVLPITHHDWIVRPLFRDYLIAHPNIKNLYADLKQTLATQHQADREAYTQSKTAFIQDIDLQAIHPHLHFKPLAETDFPWLLKWLETPHVKAWWDPSISWTATQVQEKYLTYTQGYRIEKNHKKPIFAHMILIQNTPIGYIQSYDAHDFMPATLLAELPAKLAGLDFYIGESTWLHRGIGALILKKYVIEHISPRFDGCLVDPARTHLIAQKCYQNAGFVILRETEDTCYLLWKKTNHS